jgi:hypothetical protein
MPSKLFSLRLFKNNKFMPGEYGVLPGLSKASWSFLIRDVQTKVVAGH